jgi:hypothetical protein
VTLNYSFSNHNNLRLFYRTSTRAPSIGQLQNVVDNSNPLLLTAGNPNLTQSYDETVVSRYSLTDAGNGQSFFLLFSAVRTNDYIGNSTLTAGRDTSIQSGIRLSKGTQLTIPVNLDGYWSIRSFLTYSIALGFIQSNLNLNSGFTYSRTPGLVDESENFSKSSVFSEGMVISSNISENVDFTLSYTGNFNVSRNTLQSSLDNNYYYHTAGVKLNLIFLDGIVFRNEVNNTLYNGLTGNFNQNFVLWNISLGRKFFENQRGELKITVTDLLDQNKSVNRNVTDTYVEDTQNNVLGRYFMAMFTYTVR